MSEDFARAFISFFAIIDPLGNLIVFYLLTQPLPSTQRRLVAVVSIIMAFALLLLFILAGQEVFDFLDISFDSFKAAAGLMLLLPAYRLVSEGQPIEVKPGEKVDPMQVALVPLATPLIAGPGALATAISLTNDMGRGITISSSALVLALSLAIFAAAGWLFEKLGLSFLRLLSRLVGILLFAIAVDLVLEGLKDFFEA
jgi:multiple antibiotic resistance protein